MSDHSITTQPATRSALPIRWWQAVLLLCLFVSATGLGIYWGQTHIVAGIENGFLEVDPEHLDFGEVWVQDKFQWTLPITNTSSEPVEVLEFRSSCNCLSIEPKTLVLAPGETSDVHLTLDLTTRNPEQAAKASRRFSVRIAPIITGGLAQYTGWEIQGQVRSVFTVVPLPIEFGRELVRGTPFPSASAQIVCRSPKTIIAARCDALLASVELTRSSHEPLVYSLRVSPEASLAIGPVQIPIVLHATVDGGEEIPPVTVLAMGRVVDDVQILPAIVSLGVVKPQTVHVCSFSVLSRTGKPFSLGAPTYDATALRLNAEGSEFTVSLVHPAKGRNRFRIKIPVTQEEHEGRVVEYELTFELSALVNAD